MRDNEAKIRVVSLVNNFKIKGHKQIDMIDLVSELKLPANQIERVMFKLEKEGIVSEDE